MSYFNIMYFLRLCDGKFISPFSFPSLKPVTPAQPLQWHHTITQWRTFYKVPDQYSSQLSIAHTHKKNKTTRILSLSQNNWSLLFQSFYFSPLCCVSISIVIYSWPFEIRKYVGAGFHLCWLKPVRFLFPSCQHTLGHIP